MCSTKLLINLSLSPFQGKTCTISYFAMVFALLLSLLISYFAVRFLLKLDEDYGELKQFPIDYVSVLVVLIYGVLFVLSYRRNVYDMQTYFFFTCYFTMLLITAYVDLRTKYIYDLVLFVSTILLFAISFFIEAFNIKNSLISMSFGALFYGLIYLIARLIYKREAFGQGDIVLMAVASMPLDPAKTLLSCFLSFYLAAIFLLFGFILRLKKSGSNEIPFGPYICLSSVIMWTYGDEIVFFINSLLLRNI